jgi:hypothetical protein
MPKWGSPWRALLIAAPFWVAPAAWVSLTPPFSAPLTPVGDTRAALKDSRDALKTYVEQRGKTPTDGAELRAWSRAEGRRTASYDGWGQRISYLRLDDRHYLLRSFGADGVQNTVGTETDMGFVHWGESAANGLSYRMTPSLDPDLYPAALLAGADAPNGGAWHARVFVDPVNQVRQLVVRHRTKEGVFLVARHDAVEEFLWLPDGERLVFSATGSTRHRDGLFLWDLRDDSVVNLFDLVPDSVPISPAARGHGLFLALAGVAESGPTVAAWMAPRHDGSLDPRTFFTPEKLVAFKVPAKGGQALQFTPTVFSPTVQPLDRTYSTSGRIVGKGTSSQRTWLSLPLSGDVEQVLLAWHRHSERAARSPLFPYGLWVLASLYGDSYALMLDKGSKDADVLRTFGTEIARALVNYPLAPSYLKGLGLFAYESLMDGVRLPYRLAQLAEGAPTVAP